MGVNELKYIQEAFDENWIAPLGSNVEAFETSLEQYLENKTFVAALNSGTAALHLALIILGVGVGDEVICQSLTFAASANPIAYQGAKPIFVDSEKDTWNMCSKYLEEAIKDSLNRGKKPKAIIFVDLYGMPAKIDEILDVAERYQIPVIEDAAEALGSKYKNQKCGSFGSFSILSFNGNKIITTSGGGALVSKSTEDKSKVIFLSTQARENALHYEHKEIGYNYRLSNICAGIGRGQMEVLDSHVEQRRNNHQFYVDLLAGFKGVDFQREFSEDFFSNYWLTAITVDSSKSGFSNRDLMEELKRNNVESRPVWKPMHLQPVFKDCLYFGENIAEELFNKGLCLPSGSNLTKEQKERISEIILRYK